MVQAMLWLGALLSLFAVLAISVVTTNNDLQVPLHPGENDRCPVCGMLVAPYPDWTAQVRHGDGTTVFFDGCKDLFKYLLMFEIYAPRQDRRDVAAVFVTNYYDGEVITAHTAFFVAGSDVSGPMGAELVPHRSIEAAEDFLEDHDGRRILRFDEIDESLIREMY
ncbi:MAG: nitrous oxide reductase accessory protein NosL [Planctomycetota bacterium]|jgi:nitrous oxide reductase accessory protein NosL